jgi:hypothetical protein
MAAGQPSHTNVAALQCTICLDEGLVEVGELDSCDHRWGRAGVSAGPGVIPSQAHARWALGGELSCWSRGHAPQSTAAGPP